MSDIDKKYVPFWKKQMHRSTSSPSLSRKSGKLSKKDISEPFPADPDFLRPLNTIYDEPSGKSRKSKSSERISRSHDKKSESKWYKRDSSEESIEGYTRSKSVSHLLEDGTTSFSGKHRKMSTADNESRPVSFSSTKDEISANPQSLQLFGEIYEVPPGKAQQLARYFDNGEVLKLNESCNKGDSKPKLINSSKSPDLPFRNTEATKSLDSLTTKYNKKSNHVSFEKSHEILKAEEKDKNGGPRKSQVSDAKHNKRSLSFGFSFKNGKRTSNNKNENEKIQKQNKDKLNEDKRNIGREVKGNKTSKSYQSSSIGHSPPANDCDDSDTIHGSPIYDILTPTEIYQRRSSIRTVQNEESPADSKNSQSVSGENIFDFDIEHVNTHERPTIKKSSRTQRRHNTFSKISEASNEIEIDGCKDIPLNGSDIIHPKAQTSEVIYANSFDLISKDKDEPVFVSSPGKISNPLDSLPKNKQIIVSGVVANENQDIHPAVYHPEEVMNSSSNSNIQLDKPFVKSDTLTDFLEDKPHSDISKSPTVISQHQVVHRTSSEPPVSEDNLQVHKPLSRSQSDALQPILDDHLQKHNVKVAKELGIDINSLNTTELRAVQEGHIPDDKSSFSSLPNSSKLKKDRPASLNLRRSSDDSCLITPKSDPTQIYQNIKTPSSLDRTTSMRQKPVPPVRSPTTKITTHQFEESTSNHSTSGKSSGPVVVQNRYMTTQQRTQQGPNEQVLHRSGSQTSIFVVQGKPKGGHESSSVDTSRIYSPIMPYQKQVLQRQQYTTEYMTASRKSKIPGYKSKVMSDTTDSAPINHQKKVNPFENEQQENKPDSKPVIVGAVRKPTPRRWSLELGELEDANKFSSPVGRITHQSEGVYDMPRNQRPPAPKVLQPAILHPTSEKEVAKAAVTNWVAHCLAHSPPDVQSMYIRRKWSYRAQPNFHHPAQPNFHHPAQPNLWHHPPTIYEEMEDDIYQTYPPRHYINLKTKSSSDSDHSVGGLRTASLDRLGRRSHAHPAAHAHAHSHTPHYTLPRRPHNAQRYSHQQQFKGKGYGYSPPSAVFDDDPGIMSEAETSSTGFRRGAKQRASLPLSRQSSSKTIDSRHFDMDDNNSYWDEDPGIMSEAETSSTGRGRNAKPRTSLPIVRTPSKTLERPLGLVFLQFRGETKRALLPNEITSLDTVKALFVRSFPNQLTMQYLDQPSVKIYIHDSNKDMFYDLEDLGGTCFIRDIRDRSVLRVFEGEGVNGPGGGAWDQDQSYFSEPEFDSDFQQQHVHNKSKSGKSGGYYMTHSYPPSAPAHTAGVAPIPRGPRPQYSPERMHPSDGYLSSPERSPRPYGGGGNAYLTPTQSYEDPYYGGGVGSGGGGGQYGSRSGSVTPIIDEEARSAFYSMRVEQMERQLASLTGLVQKALHTGVGGSPRPEQITLAPPPAVVAAAAAAGNINSRDPPPTTRASNEFLQVPATSSRSGSDMRLSPEVYNQLRVLQKKAKELRTDVRNLRRSSQANALTMKEILRDTVAKITTLLQSNEEALVSGSADADRVRVQREEDSYRQDMSKLDKDLCDLEMKVEELRNNVINRRLRVNMSDVENMALILSRSSKTVADLKARFPMLQDGLKGLLSAEMEKAIRDKKFLEEEPDKLESALRRCKKLTGTLVTLKRLASVQEQRVPPNTPGVGPLVGVANGDPRATSPTPVEDARSSASKQSGVIAGAHVASAGLGANGQPRLRAENALDALLDELQTFAQPPSEAGSRKSSLDVIPSTPLATTAPATLSVNSVLTSTGVRRLPSFPSSDSQSSPVKTPANVFPGMSSTLPRPSTNTQAPQPPPRDEHRLSVASTASSGSGRSSPRGSISIEQPHRLPPPPPPRTSSKSPMLSPSSPMSPSLRSTSVPPGGIVASMAGGVIRNAEGRELYGPVLRQRPPLGRGSFSEESTASSASTNSSNSSAKAGQLSSNSSSTESVNSQEGVGSRQQNQSNVPPTPPPKQRQENLEARHLELLRRQKQLQEQYQRLQSLQRSGGRLAPANIDLKKTGSESNLAGRLGLSLAPVAHGSLSNLSSTTPSPSQASNTNTLPNPKTSSLSIASGGDTRQTTKRSSGGLVETDIL